MQTLWKTIWRFLKNLEPYDPAIPLLGMYQKKTNNSNLKRHMHPNVHSSIIYNNQDMEAKPVSISRRMNKEDMLHIYNGILLSH